MKAAFKSPMRTDSNIAENGTQKESPDEEALKKEIEALKERDNLLDQQIKELIDQGYTEDELDKHIEKLHQYNEMKDIGQSLLGNIAQKEGITTKDLYEKFGLDLDD